MKRFREGWSERVRFGFRSSACLNRDEFGTHLFCPHSKDKLFLVADMTCQSVLAEESWSSNSGGLYPEALRADPSFDTCGVIGPGADGDDVAARLS